MAKNYELEGTVKQIDDVQEFSSGFTKRDFVVEAQDGKYTQMIKFECIKDKTSLTDGFQPGDNVKVTFDIRGNEYKGRYFVNLAAWKLEKLDGSGGSQPADAPPAGDEGTPPSGTPSSGTPPSHLDEPPAGHGQSDDDIPF